MSSSDDKDDGVENVETSPGSFSSPKRRLLEAKQKDAYFEQEV
jgi:hypothetical protein